MIVRSLVDNSEWIWIRIPKTASRAYRCVFDFNEGHSHLSYTDSIFKYGNVGKAFSVVRDPVQRLKSGITHDIEQFEFDNPNVPFPSWMMDINLLCDLFFEAIGENCKIKNEKTYVDIIQDADMMCEVLKTQCSAVNHPEVKVFRYENLEEFNNWITNTLGYKTICFEVNGASNYKKYNWLDFSNPRFAELCRIIYKEDYEVYGY